MDIYTHTLLLSFILFISIYFSSKPTNMATVRFAWTSEELLFSYYGSVLTDDRGIEVPHVL